ncbi:hypothetical protein BC834DRAFT_847373 [Gloeopeniophorella convolvens]|nr:hypothetical protein BC834DRAFT_847373 [Gloeopeniophorella convolvens]
MTRMLFSNLNVSMKAHESPNNGSTCSCCLAPPSTAMTFLTNLNLNPNLTSHRTPLVLTAACAALATYSLLSLADTRVRTKRRVDLAADVQRALAGGPARAPIPPSPSALPPPLPPDTGAEELMQLTRNYAFLGEPGAGAVRRATVVVVGCGGVGGWAAVQLARPHVRRLQLVDFDYITLSSLNRHAAAARGRRHAEGYVIGAIDNIGTKVELLAHCVRRGTPIFSSMGAGAKADLMRIQIADLSATHYDPLARTVRQRLHAATYVLCALAPRPLENLLPVCHCKKLYEHPWKDLPHCESPVAHRPINGTFSVHASPLIQPGAYIIPTPNVVAPEA